MAYEVETSEGLKDLVRCNWCMWVSLVILGSGECPNCGEEGFLMDPPFNGLKIWLDDERPAPDGYIHVKTAPHCIELLKVGGGNKIVDLDHDLGTDPDTGYTVLLFIEEQVHTNPDFVCPRISIHTQNASAMLKMKQAIRKIYDVVLERTGSLPSWT